MPELRLLAWPAGHSLSPVMHNAALAELGLPWEYRAVAVPPAELPEAVEALRAPGVRGANVTVPHKEAVLPLLDSVSDAARLCGAVNTISNRDGHLHGDNTDVHGFLALLQAAGIEPAGRPGLKTVILGAGGAARAAVYALAGTAAITIMNRTRSRAEELAAAFETAAGPLTVAEAGTPPDPETELIVNTTSVGMELAGVDPDESPLPARVLPPGATVIDMVYRPAVTRLLRDAAARGLPAYNGLEMLVMQGAEALRIWTGRQDVPAAAMRGAALAALG
ncbi:MAG TPA: shikimate dehydrogenase [Deinococcales bacterium]|nr:shikimate dehydrogenase [Deinococcales bacterium]